MIAFREVADHTYVAAVEFELDGESGETNVGLVVGSEAALLIDAGGTAEQGRLLQQAAAEITDLPLTTVVLTHAHADHAFGLAGLDTTTSIAHESTRDRLALDPATPAFPTRVVSLAAAVDLGGGVRVEAVYLGRGHTDGDLVVVVPDVHVVFAGDLVESSGPPQYGPDSYPHEWPGALDGLLGPETTKQAPPAKASSAMRRVGASAPVRPVSSAPSMLPIVSKLTCWLSSNPCSSAIAKPAPSVTVVPPRSWRACGYAASGTGAAVDCS